MAVNSQPHVNERTARMRLQMATAGVQGTVCGIAGDEDGGVSSAIEAVIADWTGEYKTGRMIKRPLSLGTCDQ
jgi:hypothetical protein